MTVEKKNIWEDTATWTWEQVAALEAIDRQRFLATYGERAKVALVLADYMAGKPAMSAACSSLGEVQMWSCGDCSLDIVYAEWRPAGRRWRQPIGSGEHVVGCREAARSVYAAMVRRLGRLPEERTTTAAREG
jgi:hypothetical protein